MRVDAISFPALSRCAIARSGRIPMRGLTGPETNARRRAFATRPRGAQNRPRSPMNTSFDDSFDFSCSSRADTRFTNVLKPVSTLPMST